VTTPKSILSKGSRGKETERERPVRLWTRRREVTYWKTNREGMGLRLPLTLALWVSGSRQQFDSDTLRWLASIPFRRHGSHYSQGTSTQGRNLDGCTREALLRMHIEGSVGDKSITYVGKKAQSFDFVGVELSQSAECLTCSFEHEFEWREQFVILLHHYLTHLHH
jgi:hypothetical protein